MDNKYIMKMKYPSGWWQARWREAVPLGNGITGASVYGGVWDETIMITHTDLYWKSKTPDLPDVSYALPEIREMLLNNQAYEADKKMIEELKSLGYYAKMAFPLPVCDLKVKMETHNGFKNYERNLDMKRGEALVQWNDGESTMLRKGFVSYVEDVFVYEIKEKSGLTFSCDLKLDQHELEDAQWYRVGLEEFLPKERVSEVQKASYLVYTAQNDDGTDFGAVAKVVVEGGSYEVVDNSVTVKEAQKVNVILKTFIRGDRNTTIQETINTLDTIHMSYDDLLQEHVEQWTPLFMTAELDLNALDYNRSNEELLLDAYQGEASLEMIEKMWNYGRYLLASASKKGGNPCNLYGLWCGEYKAIWSFNMVNENLEMLYWQALTGNTPELLLPLFDYIDRLMDDFRINAKNLFGCRGIFVPGPTCPDSGLIKIKMAHLLYWTGGAGWVGQHYYDYYLCTQDKEFLRNRAIPYLKEVVLFYEDFFVIGDNGKYMTIPSNSPENSPGNYWDGKSGMGIVMETTMNATMDFAIAKEVLTNLIEGCTICGIEAEEIKKWEEMLTKIPAYEINEDGAVKEWMHEYFIDNYRHRHQSHLYPLFPGNEIHKETDPELYEAFVVAVKKRLQIGLNQQTGWSLAHMSNNYARMGENELALECLDLMSRACVLNNFMTTHNDWRQMGIGVRLDWAPIQLDANLGLTAAINEMLMQSYGNTLLILPAIPSRFVKGSVKRLLSRQGLLVSIEWDMDKGEIIVEIDNRHDAKEVTLILPDGYSCLDLNDGNLVVEEGITKIKIMK